MSQLFELIDLTKNMGMPAIWSSEKGAEGFIWGDFLLAFQVSPKTVGTVAMEMCNKSPSPSPIQHLYSLIVFYRAESSPHGPSSRPILAFSIEKTNASALKSLLGVEVEQEQVDDYFVYEYNGSGHINRGTITKDLVNQEKAKELLLEMFSKRCKPFGPLESFGELKNILGLNTGSITLEEARKKRDKRGMGVFFRSLFS